MTFDAEAGTLVVRISATCKAQLAGLEEAVARNLDRFAFREAPPRFDWRPIVVDGVSSLATP